MANIQVTDEELVMLVSALNAYRKQNEKIAAEFASSDDEDRRPLGSLYSRLAIKASALAIKVGASNGGGS